MAAEKTIKPRTAFRHFLNYLQSDMIDFEKLETDGMMDTYFKAMQFVGEVAANTSYSPFYKEDGELLLSIQSQILSLQELVALKESSVQSLAPKMNKLINLGVVSSFKENKITFYRITPYGLKFLEELIQDESGVLYL